MHDGEWMFGSVKHGSKAHEKIRKELVHAGVWDEDPNDAHPNMDQQETKVMDFTLPLWVGWDGGHISHAGTFVRGLSKGEEDPSWEVD